MTDPLLVRALVACYPPAWRRRYGDEYAALLADTVAVTRPWRRVALILNALRGALDARLYPGGVPVLASRSPMSVAIWATALFTIAGIGFQRMSEHVTGTGVDAAFAVVVVAATIALAAVVVAALPALVAMLRGRSSSAWRYVGVAVVAVATWFGVLAIGKAIARDRTVHSGLNLTGALVVIAAGIAVVAVVAWGAAATLRRVDEPGPDRLRPLSMTVLAAGMAATTLACLAWGIAVEHAHASVTTGPSGGLLATPFLPSWIVIVVLMAGATLLAGSAARRQARTGSERVAAA